MKQIDIDRYNESRYGYDLEYFKHQEILNIMGLQVGEETNKDISLYDLILDPKYKWREMFDNNADYQREFWEWMDKMLYGIYVGGMRISSKTIPSQMLTGYILEFMMERI